MKRKLIDVVFPTEKTDVLLKSRELGGYAAYRNDFIKVYGRKSREEELQNIVNKIEEGVMEKKELSDTVMNDLIREAILAKDEWRLEFLTNFYTHLREIQKLYAISCGESINCGFRVRTYLRIENEMKEALWDSNELLGIEVIDEVYKLEPFHLGRLSQWLCDKLLTTLVCRAEIVEKLRDMLKEEAAFIEKLHKLRDGIDISVEVAATEFIGEFVCKFIECSELIQTKSAGGSTLLTFKPEHMRDIVTSDSLLIGPKNLPMVERPQDWTITGVHFNSKNGGYLSNSEYAIMTLVKQKWDCKSEFKPSRLDMEALNILQSFP